MRILIYLCFIVVLAFLPDLAGQPLPTPGVQEIHISGQITRAPFSEIILQANDEDFFLFFEDNPGWDYYQFQLLGFDKAPIRLKYPYTRYTNLKGGDYEFVLSGIMGADTTEASRLSISVMHKTAESPWFVPALVIYVLLVVFAIASLWLMYHYRQKIRLQNIRNQIAADLHDEVGSTLNSIAIFGEALKKNLSNGNTEIEQTVEEIIHSAESTNHNLRDTVWTLNPTQDKAENLFEKVRSEAAVVFAAKEIRFSFEVDPSARENFEISMLQRRNIYMIAREAINNIVKHAEAGAASMSVKKEGRKIRLTIQDDGRGFDERLLEEGNGMKNFRKRAAESFIKFSIASKPGGGTTVILLIPQL